MKEMKISRRLGFLDAARGIAALSVLLYHVFAGETPFHAFTVNKFNLGDFGVYLFFMVSGFIIPVTMERHQTVGAFWKSRFLRLFPPYWFSLAVALVLGAVGLMPLEEGFFLHAWRNIAGNITMLALLLHVSPALGVYWTLAIELIFYVLCSVLKLTRLIEKRLTVMYIGIAIYLLSILACTTRHFSPLHFQATNGGLLLTALLGSVVYQVYIGKRKASSLLLLTPILLATIISGVWMRYGLHPQSGNGVYFGFTAQATAWTTAILCFFLIYACRDLKFSAPLLWLGRISYSLYLMHAISIWLTEYLPVPKWLFYILALTVSLATAELCYRFIEKPFTALAGRVRTTPSESSGPRAARV